jgi:PAS domain S-box-containing protein
MKWPDFRQLDGYLPADVEKAYRLHYLKGDTRTASISMLLLCILLVGFAYNDYLLFGFTLTFYFLVGLRSAYLIYFIILIISLYKNQDPRKFDINMLVWLILSMILVFAINLTRPASYAGNFTIDVILVILVYLGKPMPLISRCVGAFIFTIGEILMLVLFRQLGSPVIVYSAVFALVAANVGGIFASSILYSTRRSGFKARTEQEKIAAEWQVTFDSIADPISIHSSDYRLTRVNKAYADSFKMKPEELIGRHCYEIVHGTTAPLGNCPHAQTLKTGKPVVEEIFEPRLGAYLEISTSPMINDVGEITATVHIVKDRSERQQLLQKLEELSTHDFLTGLPNRLLAQDRFDVAATQARRRGNKLALMSLDLDKFKLVNDSLGHMAGDELLKEAASRLRSIIRTSDTVARVGGDEFILLLPGIDNQGVAAKIAEKIISAFQKPFFIDGGPLP